MARMFVLAGAGLVLAGALVGCAPKEQSEVEFLVPVTVKEVAKGDVEDHIVATGALRALEVATLTTETIGTLEIARSGGRFLGEGDRVTAGQLIATVTGDDIPVASRAEATARRFEAAQRDYEAKKRLVSEGLIPEQEVKLAEATLAEAKLDRDRSSLTERRTRLVSPIAGVILRLARNQQGEIQARGQIVAAGVVAAQIAPTARLIADLDLVGPDAARAKVGLPARVRALSLAERTFDGSVIRLAPQLDATTRTLRAEVQVENADDVLKPGMFVEATLVVERRQGVVVAPRNAVTEREGAPVVFVLTGQKVARRPVTLGLGDDETVEIRKGLATGDRVVVQGLETLADGARVRVSGG